MRIISGKYKGIFLEGFDIDGTRPTMDRIKESMFGTIQNKIKDSICLDLFAGSGSLGLEAISSGAKKIIFVDENLKVIDILKKNIIKCQNLKDYEIINSDYQKALNNLKNVKFNKQ